MLSIYLSLVVFGVMIAVAGPRSFLLGLGTVIVATFWMIGKILKIAFDIIDILDIISTILSLFG